MKKIIKYLLLSLSITLMSLNMVNISKADEKATPKDVMEMVKKAVAHYKEVGPKAFADFNDVSNRDFHRGELYILVYDLKGVCLAHGLNPRLIGKNLYDLKDIDGTPVTKSFIDIAVAKGAGWVEFKWPNPVTKKLEQKVTYVEKVDNIVIGSGVYK